MKQINATQARNEFFSLIEESFIKNKSFLIKKSGIPMVYIVPAKKGQAQETTELSPEAVKHIQALDHLDQIQQDQPEAPSNVDLIKEMRQEHV